MDRETFAVSVQSRQDALFRVAFSILQNREDAFDAVQEAILRAWTARHRLKDEAFFGTWLTRIVINISRDMLKKRRPFASIPATPDASPALAELCTLPEKLRLPVVLHYIDGYSVSETADILHLPTSTIRGRLARARKQLRLELTGEEDRHASV